MNYKTRSGFVLLKICDTHLLVAKRERWAECAGVRPLPKKHVVLWTIMEQGKTSDEAIRSLSELFQKPVEDVEKLFSPVIEELAGGGYLIPAENTES